MPNKRTCWFVDLENVGASRLRLYFSKFGSDDTVFVVYSQACMNVIEECKRWLDPLDVGLRFVFSPLRGDNALDFVLVAELSRMTVVEPDNDYVIISGDLGFDSTVAYFRKQGISVRRLSPTNVGMAGLANKKPLNKVQRHVLYDFIVTNGLKLSGGRKYQYLNEICQRYVKSSRKANLLYYSLRPILDDKQELFERKLELGFKW